MPTRTADEAAVREQAYYFWEQDGRPHGRESEYWARAEVAVADKAQMDTLVEPAPRKPAKPKAAPAVKAAAKTSSKSAASAASKSKAAPAKAEAAKKPKKK